MLGNAVASGENVFMLGKSNTSLAAELDNVELSMISICGQVLSVLQNSTNMTLNVQDDANTGATMEVKKWMSGGDEGPSADSYAMESIHEGSFVKVIGHLRTFGYFKY